ASSRPAPTSPTPRHTCSIPSPPGSSATLPSSWYGHRRPRCPSASRRPTERSPRCTPSGIPMARCLDWRPGPTTSTCWPGIWPASRHRSRWPLRRSCEGESLNCPAGWRARPGRRGPATRIDLMSPSPSTPSASNPSTAQARVLVDELVRHGVRDAVLCPGSRSAPLALALAAAERAGLIRLHVRIDERGAGYLALGLAAGSGSAVPVVVTSGTAVANRHPAMAEAAQSGVPVMALTANRPPELRGTGANQTIDQVGLFGPHARAVVELGVATDAEAEHHHWRAGIGRAVLTATAYTDPGPVQVDIAFREPLVPAVGDEDPAARDAGPVGTPEGRPGGRPWVTRAAAETDAAPVGSTVALDLTRRTLVVAGAGARPVAGLVGVPTVAEPGAPVPLHPVHPLAVSSLRPEQVVVH